MALLDEVGASSLRFGRDMVSASTEAHLQLLRQRPSRRGSGTAARACSCRSRRSAARCRTARSRSARCSRVRGSSTATPERPRRCPRWWWCARRARRGCPTSLVPPKVPLDIEGRGLLRHGVGVVRIHLRQRQREVERRVRRQTGSRRAEERIRFAVQALQKREQLRGR